MGGCCSLRNDKHYTLNSIFGTSVSAKKSVMLRPKEAMVKQGTIALHVANMVRRKSEEIHKEYKILEVLGKGTYGEVHKAIHRKTGRTRAVKNVSRIGMNEDQALRLTNEVEILKKLVSGIIKDHPNIIRVYEFYEDQFFFFIVTELCTGGELFDRITAKTMVEEKESAIIMKQILSAVVHLHANNIVHRDLKPENIMYESDSIKAQLKIIDFGTSRVFAKNEVLCNTYGTVYYIAPEVLWGSYNEKCDIWSCGVILYVLLCGYPPFGGKKDVEVMEKIKSGPLSFDGVEWEDISDSAKDLISRMMDYNIEKRFSSEKALEHVWLQKNSQKKISQVNFSKVLQNLKNFQVCKIN